MSGLTATEVADPRIDFETVRSKVGVHMEALSSFLANQVEAFEPETREMVRYCLRHEGKRLRPLLVFYAGGLDTVADEMFSGLVRAAAVVELVHQATLVHDDILDDASLRHSAETPWERYGASAAVLLGDALFAQALHLASSFETVEICRAVSRATRRVCTGEIAQTLHRGELNQNFETYFRVIDLKTAELFSVSCQLGASIAGYDRECVEAASAFGRKLGIAYQIFDDLADYAGDEARIGKTLGTDLASGKVTLPLLHLLDSLGEKHGREVLANLLSGAQTARGLMPLLSEHGALDRTCERFHAELDAGEALLEPVAASYPASQGLFMLARFIRQQVRRFESAAG